MINLIKLNNESFMDLELKKSERNNIVCIDIYVIWKKK